MPNRAFPSVTPGHSTSAVQGVFGVTLGTGNVWPSGTVIEHTLDGASDTFTVPDDQGTTPVYLPYHDLGLGVHEWEGKVTFPDGEVSTLYPFTWEIVEPHTQVPQNTVVNLEGTIHANGGMVADTGGPAPEPVPEPVPTPSV